jgi:hypothetical protein
VICVFSVESHLPETLIESPLRNVPWNVLEVEPNVVVSAMSVVLAIPLTESTYAEMSVSDPAALSSLNDDDLAATNAMMFFP